MQTLNYDNVNYEVMHPIKSRSYEKNSINCYTYEMEPMKCHAQIRISDKNKSNILFMNYMN